MSASTSISTPFSSATSLRSKLSAGSGDGSGDDDGSGSGVGGRRSGSGFDGGPSAGSVLSASLALTDLAFGIYAVELWRYDEATGKLVNVDLARGTAADEEAGGGGKGGLLIKRRTQESDPTNDYSTPAARDAYERLTDRSRRDFLPAASVDPGVGLPGALWAEEAHSRLLGGAVRKNLLASVHHHGHMSHRNVAGTGGGDHPAGGHHGGSDGVSWRDVGELADDPDQPHDERLQAFAKAGFTLAAGVPFDIHGYRGLVVYFGNPRAEAEKLRNPANARFLGNAAQMIGAAAAIQGPTRDIERFREQISRHNWRRLKIKVLSTLRFGGSLRKKQQQDDLEEASVGSSKTWASTSLSKFLETGASYRQDAGAMLREARAGVGNKLSRWGKKVRGGGAGIPPAFGYTQCLWTFVGVMTTHTILSRINLLIQTESDGNLSLILAPLGALTTLQYNLTAAPASQPRNAIFAQIFAITTAILVSYIPNVEPWFRSALAPAIVIPGMAKLGIVHPPAGAAAIVFSSGAVRWEHFGIFLAGVAISIVTAVGINNMSDRRQYPTSWYLVNKAINP